MYCMKKTKQINVKHDGHGKILYDVRLTDAKVAALIPVSGVIISGEST